jgi:hypothetical protein
VASLTVAVKGDDPAAGVARELRAMSDASVRAQKYADNNTKLRLRAATSGPLGPKVANAWRDRAYPNDAGLGPDSRSMVWTRAPNIIASAVEAPVIRAQGGWSGASAAAASPPRRSRPARTTWSCSSWCRWCG